jgi:hypothetical protein
VDLPVFYLSFLYEWFGGNADALAASFNGNIKYAAKLDFYDAQCKDVAFSPTDFSGFYRKYKDSQTTDYQKIATAIPAGVDHIQDGGRNVCTFYMYDMQPRNVKNAIHKIFPEIEAAITENKVPTIPTRSVAAELDIEGSSQELLPEHAEL